MINENDMTVKINENKIVNDEIKDKVEYYVENEVKKMLSVVLVAVKLKYQ